MIKQKTGSPTNAEREAKKAVINACTLTASTDEEQIGVMGAIGAGRHLISRTKTVEEEPAIAEMYKTNTNRT